LGNDACVRGLSLHSCVLTIVAGIAELDKSQPLHIEQLLTRVNFGHVLLGAQVARLHHVSSQLEVAVHHQSLVWSICVDADSAGVEHRVRRLTLLPTQLDVAFKLARVRRLLTK
jgi:hypothetical protein